MSHIAKKRKGFRNKDTLNKLFVTHGFCKPLTAAKDKVGTGETIDGKRY
jgi:hypothetical protein